MADPVDLPDSIIDQLEGVREQIQRLQQQFNTYLQGRADMAGVEDLFQYEIDFQEGQLVPVEDSEER